MTEPVKNYRLGWKRSLPDHRDLKFSDNSVVCLSLPSKIDLRPHCPPVYDQGNLGSCTANASGALAEYMLGLKGVPNFMPSRLFIYYNERVIEDSVDYDSGATLRDAVKVLSKYGAPKETLWPYDTSKFKLKPPKQAYDNGLQHTATSYIKLDNTNLNELKTALVNGYPFVMGFTVYESFQSNEVANTGKMPMPAKHEQALGGHAVLGVGYDDATNAFIIRNSWGTSWGDKGYFYMPYDFITNTDFADDFWIIKNIKKY